MNHDSQTRPEEPNRKLRGMVLAAGFGKRLRPLTLLRAKPAVPFLNRPLIEYTFDLFRQAGVQEFVINLHHLPKSVFDVVSRYLDAPSGKVWNPWILFSDEPEILGTGGGIVRVREFLKDDDFIVSNGKIYFEQDLRPALEFHRRSGAAVTMVLLKHNGHEPFNPVLMDDDGRIRGFALKTGLSDFRDAYVYTGVQIVSPEFFDFAPPGPSETVRDIYPEMIRKRRKVLGFVSQAVWCECSEPRRYLEESVRMLRRLGGESLFEDAAPEGSRLRGVVGGSRVEVAAGCELENVVLWDGAKVGPDSRLRNVIICGGLELPPGIELSDTIVCPPLDLLPGSAMPESRIDEPFLRWPLK